MGALHILRRTVAVGFVSVATSSSLVSMVAGIAMAGTTVEGEPSRSIAVLDFETADETLKDRAAQIVALLSARLSAQPGTILVERQRLDQVLSELELGISGTVQAETAASIGRLLGAKALITGRVFGAADEMVVTARLIGTETGRVYVETASLPSNEPASRFADVLAEGLNGHLGERWNTLVATAEPVEDRIERLTKLAAGRTLPSVSVSVAERHVGRDVLDPAAQTEIAMILSSVGFRLVDTTRPDARADIQITGEAFSAVGLRRGNLVSASGRVEIKAVDSATHDIVAVDRQSDVAVDLSGEMAGKKALQQAAAALSERLVLSLLKSL